MHYSCFVLSEKQQLQLYHNYNDTYCWYLLLT